MTSLNLGAAASVALRTNKELAKAAAYIEAGRIVNNKLVQLIGPKLPAMLRGYASEPIGKLVLANLLLVGVQKFKPDHVALQKLAYSGVTSAYGEVFQKFDIEGLIDGFMGDSAIGKALGLVDVAESAVQQ